MAKGKKIKGQGEFDDTKEIISSHKSEERIQWPKKKIKGQGEFDDTKGIFMTADYPFGIIKLSLSFYLFPLAIVFFLQIYGC
jgi:hypothetical protein